MDECKEKILNKERLMIRVNTAVMNERVSQNQKWGYQRHNFGKWLAILMEEVGEVAEASQPGLGLETTKETDANDLYKELLQVSAVASAWAEQVLEDLLKTEIGA